MDVRVPQLGEGADSGSVVSIFVKEGDKIKKDQTIIELENEKAVAPIPSPAAGTVTKVHVKTGDKISVGQLVISLAEEGTPSEALRQAAPPAQAAAAKEAPRSVESGAYHYESKSGFPPPASPSVRKMAEDLGIDLARVRGSEAGGRIVLADLRAFVESLQRTAGSPAQAAPAKALKPPESIDFSKWGTVEKKPLSSLRQKIAEKMTESWTTIPHVTQFDDADITALMALRKKYAPAYEKKGAILTLTSFIIKAAVAALKKFPVVNSSLDEAAGQLVVKKYYHIGVAVDTEQGLIVPVLRDVDKKSLLEISKELGELAEKTRQRKVSLDELKGGTFTVSNLGGIGGTHFTPIINKPEVAILGVGRGAGKLPLALSYDHRVVDGADGARFMRAVVEALENFKEEEVKI
ncbi:MAG: 2-oxo acid dehydrogenase subunit E2 [Candidatus Omnitrophota bacterium]